ncbi:hypothetical protein K438DRAFT_1775952 [Mycena galopus ATCC 62051]|nr:hypothetical protein K438DRAFT_1775952 [Mycena galopus ATCC 62051]
MDVPRQTRQTAAAQRALVEEKEKEKKRPKLKRAKELKISRFKLDDWDLSYVTWRVGTCIIPVSPPSCSPVISAPPLTPPLPIVSPLPESRPPVNPVPPAKVLPKSRKKAIGAKAAGKEVAAAGAKKVVSVAEVVKRKPERPRKTPLDDITNAIVGAEAAPPVSARTPVVYTSTDNNWACARAAAEAEKAAKIKEAEEALAKQATKGWVQSTTDGATVVTLMPLNPLMRTRKATKYPDGSVVPAVGTTAALAAKKKLDASEAALLVRMEAKTGAKRKASKSESSDIHDGVESIAVQPAALPYITSLTRALYEYVHLWKNFGGEEGSYKENQDCIRRTWSKKKVGLERNCLKKGRLYGGLKPSSSAARLQTNGFPAVTGTCGVGVDDLEGKIQFGVHGAFHGALKGTYNKLQYIHDAVMAIKKQPVIEEVMDGTCPTPREMTCIRVRNSEGTASTVWQRRGGERLVRRRQAEGLNKPRAAGGSEARKKWAGGRREARQWRGAGTTKWAKRARRSGWERGGGSGQGGADPSVPERGADGGGRRAAEAQGKGPANRKVSRNQGPAASRSKAGKRVGRLRCSQSGHSQPRVALAARGIGDRGERKGCKRVLGAEGIPVILGAGGVFLLSFLVEGNGK